MVDTPLDFVAQYATAHTTVCAAGPLVVSVFCGSDLRDSLSVAVWLVLLGALLGQPEGANAIVATGNTGDPCDTRIAPSRNVNGGARR